jgi:hypothetical protein
MMAASICILASMVSMVSPLYWHIREIVNIVLQELLDWEKNHEAFICGIGYHLCLFIDTCYCARVVKFEHGLQMTKPKPVDTIVEIAGCEYVLKYYPGAYQGYMLFSHKGNCKYCEARFRDTIRQVVSEALANQTAEAAK